MKLYLKINTTFNDFKSTDNLNLVSKHIMTSQSE